MDRQHLTMILSSSYIDAKFKEKHSSADDLPRHRILEYIMTNGVQPENGLIDHLRWMALPVRAAIL